MILKGNLSRNPSVHLQQWWRCKPRIFFDFDKVGNFGESIRLFPMENTFQSQHFLNTHTHIYMYTCIVTHMHKHIHIHAFVLALMHFHIETYMHLHMHTLHMQAHAHTYIAHTHTHAHTRTYIHTNTHIHIQTHTHTHIWMCYPVKTGRPYDIDFYVIEWIRKGERDEHSSILRIRLMFRYFVFSCSFKRVMAT